ncbi:hypothetical protein LINGRAHAP2_LOCUS23344 [Linum grandiflorum]
MCKKSGFSRPRDSRGSHPIRIRSRCWWSGGDQKPTPSTCSTESAH